MGWIKEYLSFHRKERRGIITLLCIITLLIGFNIYQRYFWKTGWESATLEFGPQIVRFSERVDSAKEQTATPTPWIPKKKNLFRFDPNTLDSAGWVRLGFSPKQAASIINYRSAGAQFRKPMDLKKLFVVDDERYAQLEPYIEIKETIRETPKKPRYEKPKWEKPEYKKVTVELNSADSASLIKVKGIGPFFARVMVEYRDKLGGYLNKEQVLEVYGMDSAKYERMADQLTVDPGIRTLLNVNEADLKQLVRHPYINFNQAKAIVNYRNQHGNFNAIAEMENIHLLKGETYRKIAPYFTVE